MKPTLQEERNPMDIETFKSMVAAANVAAEEKKRVELARIEERKGKALAAFKGEKGQDLVLRTLVGNYGEKGARGMGVSLLLNAIGSKSLAGVSLRSLTTGDVIAAVQEWQANTNAAPLAGLIEITKGARKKGTALRLSDALLFPTNMEEEEDEAEVAAK